MNEKKGETQDKGQYISSMSAFLSSGRQFLTARTEGPGAGEKEGGERRMSKKTDRLAARVRGQITRANLSFLRPKKSRLQEEEEGGLRGLPEGREI